jgi:ribosomal protein S18 acetylase RimI-like enzyme
MMIRVATKADGEAIAKLHATGWKTAYHNMLPDDFLAGPVVEERLDFWANCLTSPAKNQFILIAEEDEQMIGFICIRLNEDKQFGSMIDNLHVDPSQQGKKVGRRLMAEAAKLILSKAPDQGVWLWVYQQNEQARKFYTRLSGIESESSLLISTAGNTVLSIRCIWSSPTQLIDGIENKKQPS